MTRPRVALISVARGRPAFIKAEPSFRIFKLWTRKSSPSFGISVAPKDLSKRRFCSSKRPKEEKIFAPSALSIWSIRFESFIQRLKPNYDIVHDDLEQGISWVAQRGWTRTNLASGMPYWYFLAADLLDQFSEALFALDGIRQSKRPLLREQS